MAEHPSSDDLSGFLLGKLPANKADAVAEHVEVCPPCQQTVHDLEAHKDTLLRGLGQPAPPAPATDADCRRAMEQAAALVPDMSAAQAAPAISPGTSAAGKPLGPSRQQFIAALSASGLISADDWKKLLADVPALSTAADGEALARLLIERGTLTKFQATALYQGKSKGLVYGDYVLLAKLGAGGMGDVYKAQHRRMDRIVALKVLSPAALNSPDAVKRFHREVKAAARLTHPNIVIAYDAGAAGSVHYLVMEYVAGDDLANLVKKSGPLPVTQAVDYVRQAACGLAYAHAEGVVHRDIKPANLLLDKKGTVKVLDMGLARFDDGGTQAAADGLTQSGQVMGTVDFMAPEQAFDTRHADARADVYSLGCTLHRLLTGQTLFTGETLVQKLLAHREQPIPALSALRADVPAELGALFQRMVAKQIADRPSMADVASELETIGRTLAQPSTASPAAVNAAKISTAAPLTRDAKGPPRKNRRPLVGAAAGGFLLVALGVWIIVRDRDGKELARVEAPTGATVEVQTGELSRGQAASPGALLPPGEGARVSGRPAPADASPSGAERRAVQWAFSLGGEVMVEIKATATGPAKEIRKLDELPASPLAVTRILLSNSGEKPTDAGLENLRGLTAITSLEFEHGRAASLTDAGLAVVAELPLLQRLRLNGGQITDAGLARLAALGKLESLYLDDCKFVSDDGVRALAGLPLRQLSLVHTAVTDSSVPLIAQNWPNLTSIGLPPRAVTSEAAKSLAALPKLIGLSIRDNDELRDEQLHDLAVLKQLQHLSVRHSKKISDAGLEHLAALSGLAVLEVQGTKVTAAGVAKLQKALPNCKIGFK